MHKIQNLISLLHLSERPVIKYYENAALTVKTKLPYKHNYWVK